MKNLIRLALVVMAGALFVSCESMGRFQDDMSNRWDDYVEADEERWVAFEAGSITREEYMVERKAAAAALETYTEERVIQAKDEMKEELVKKTSGPITGNPMIDSLIGAAGLVLGGGWQLNRMRDGRRRRRKEPVAVPDEDPTPKV